MLLRGQYLIECCCLMYINTSSMKYKIINLMHFANKLKLWTNQKHEKIHDQLLVQCKSYNLVICPPSRLDLDLNWSNLWNSTPTHHHTPHPLKPSTNKLISARIKVMFEISDATYVEHSSIISMFICKIMNMIHHLF